MREDVTYNVIISAPKVCRAVCFGAFFGSDHMQEEFMREAIELAQKGMGFVSPNPMVGAVIVRDGEIIGRGYHKKYGDLHAERAAFADCEARGVDCTGAEMYVTLEPCCHQGKQPPCTDAIIGHGIKRVYIGSSDPNPLVSGRGVAILRENGIEVVEGVLKDECDAINKIFFKFITKHLPFVTVKYAMTMDGKIACKTGESKWVTGEAARENVHRDRLKHAAIMVGVGTVLRDDPMLTCRLEGGRDPIRIVCDSTLRTPLTSNVVCTARTVPTIIATLESDVAVTQPYIDKGCTILTFRGKNGRPDLRQLMKTLSSLNIDSVLIEGGGELNWSALEAGIVDKVQTYIAPKIFGGVGAKSPVAGLGADKPDDAFMLETVAIKHFGDDILIESRVKNVHGNS